MLQFFSESGKRRLDEIVKPGLMCVFDFDGTLSPIVTVPDQARMPPAILTRLLKLSELAPIAIITGRSLDDVRPRLGFEPDYIVGNHGLEGMPGWESRRQSYESLCQSWKEILWAALEDKTLYDPGIRIENKRYSLSVHYRLARNQAQTEKQLTALFDRLSPPARVIAGKCVFSLIPADAANKGKALEQLMQISGAPSAIYVGDDVTDEDVFQMKRSNLLSIRIGIASDSAAKFFLPHQPEIVQLLDDLIGRLRKLTAADAMKPLSVGSSKP